MVKFLLENEFLSISFPRSLTMVNDNLTIFFMNNFGYRINRMFPSWYQTLSDKVCQWLSTGQWFSPGPPPIKLTPRYSWNIVESGAKHHQTNKHFKCLCYYFSFLCFRVCVWLYGGYFFSFVCFVCLFLFIRLFGCLFLLDFFVCFPSFFFFFVFVLCLFYLGNQSNYSKTTNLHNSIRVYLIIFLEMKK